MSYPVLLEACERGDLEEIRRLLEEEGASVDQKFPLGRTPLICASMDGNVEAVRLLLEKGATVDIRGAFGNTALHWAASHDRSEVASALLRAGASMGRLLFDESICRKNVPPTLPNDKKKPQYPAI